MALSNRIGTRLLALLFLTTATLGAQTPPAPAASPQASALPRVYLFATGGMCVGVLLWRTTALQSVAWPARAVALALAATYSLHTYAWIAWNHTLRL